MLNRRGSSSNNDCIGEEELRDIPLLAELPSGDLAKIAEVAEFRNVKKGKCVVHSQEPGQFLMFVLSGKLKVTLSSESGREVLLDILGPGDFFGELALLTGENRSADVQAIENGTVIVLTQHDFNSIMLNNNTFNRVLLKELASRLRATTLKVGDLALLDVYRRVARVLASLCSKKQSADNNDIGVIEERPTHKELAALAGTTREMVTRALRELEEAGHLEVQGKKLILHSLPK